jgi:hypothetical protein
MGREGIPPTGDAGFVEHVVPAGAAGAAGGAGLAGEALLRAQLAAMAAQVQQQAEQLQRLQASPGASPLPSPQRSPLASPERAAASAPAPRRREPRLTDLAEYNGASGAKLDEWLAELRRAARYYQLSGAEAVEFAAARLRDAADAWWAGLGDEEQAAINGVDALAAALRARFQPVTTARVAREKLHALQQGARHIDEYVAEFTRLHAQVKDMAEPDARAQFVRGLRRELALKLEDVEWESMPLAQLVAKAARIGGRAAAAAPASAPVGRQSANQMEMDEGEAQEARIARAVLNALQAGGGSGLGARTQTQRGYQNEQRGQGHRRFSGRGPRLPLPPPNIPGVPAEVVEQRRAAGQCFRCGDASHRSIECPNLPSAMPRGN